MPGAMSASYGIANSYMPASDTVQLAGRQRGIDPLAQIGVDAEHCATTSRN